MRALRHLIPSFPLYGWIPTIIMLTWEPQGWYTTVGFGAVIAETYLLYPYLAAWAGRPGYSDRLPEGWGIAIGVCHWLVVYGICFFSTRRMANRTAIGVSLGIMASSVVLAYLVLGSLGYGVCFFFE